VSLIIPTRNGLHLISQCIESIISKTTYSNYEILVIDNGSDDLEVLNYFSSFSGGTKVRIIRDDSPFNYSALNNRAVAHVDGEYIGLLNNDIEVITPEWLDEMLSLAAQKNAGAIGACLWYPNNTLQHGGVVLGVGGVAGHAHKFLSKENFGYFGRAKLVHGVSVVTGACLLVKKSIYFEVGGLNEFALAIAFNDVDFCLKVREAGYHNAWTPFAELYHHESASRGLEDTPEKQLRFAREIEYMQKTWAGALRNDPAYSPNLTLDHEDLSLAWPPRCGESWRIL
jgi:GT2 family glycosyltransferase